MAGRNDPCPCGSGKKYKKCCLDADERKSRDLNAGQRLRLRFRAAVAEVHDLAVQAVGIDFLENWSAEFQEGGNPRLEIEIFREFLALHVPFQFSPCMAEWYLSRTDPRLADAKILKDAAASPYSIVEVGGSGETGEYSVRDLLRRHSSEVQPDPALEAASGKNALMAKLLEWEGRTFLLSAYPLPLPLSVAERIAAEIRGKRKKLTDAQLLKPATAAGLYLEWRVEARLDNDSGPVQGANPLRDRRMTRDYYTYAPRTEHWVTSALDAIPDLRRKEKGVYHLMVDGEGRATVRLGQGRLVAESLWVSDRDELARLLEEATGELLAYVEREEANILEHVLAGNWDKPILPGAPNLAECVSSEERAVFEDLIAELQSAGLTAADLEALDLDEDEAFDEDDDDEGDDYSVAEVTGNFLCHREETVSPTTFKRDVIAMNLLEMFLNIQGWKLLGDEEGAPGRFIHEATYMTTLAFLEPFLAFCRTTPLVTSSTQEKGIRTSLRVYFVWLGNERLIRQEELDLAMDLLS